MAGLAAYLAVFPPSRDKKVCLSLCILAAVLPDIDYLGIWLFRHSFQPRFTHSLIFCLLAAFALWLAGRRVVQEQESRRLLIGVILASLSHPLLDLLVGAHPVPLLWPWPWPGISITYGILPSAGKLAISNVYLWRNLLIEFGVLGPMLALVAGARLRWSRRAWFAAAIALLPVFLVALTWSIQLER